MILLLGGTSESAPIATGLAERGHAVIVSTATDIKLNTGNHKLIKRRSGMLKPEAMEELIKKEDVALLVDATHPYAAMVRKTSREIATGLNLPYLTYIRPRTEFNYHKITWTNSHDVAAKVAVSFENPVLLMTGSRNLVPYVNESKNSGVDLYARVLNNDDSLKACREAGLAFDKVITGRGPFSVKTNIEQMELYGVGTIVTKDTGRSGGAYEKIDAAKALGAEVVVVDRPDYGGEGEHGNIDSLIEAACEILK